MLIVTQTEAEAIQMGEKVATLRPIRANGKGYCRVGSIQQIRDSRNFKAPYVCKIQIMAREFVNIEDLKEADFKALRYPNKSEYMRQSYNLKNPNPCRVRYWFEVIE